MPVTPRPEFYMVFDVNMVFGASLPDASSRPKGSFTLRPNAKGGVN